MGLPAGLRRRTDAGVTVAGFTGSLKLTTGRTSRGTSVARLGGTTAATRGGPAVSAMVVNPAAWVKVAARGSFVTSLTPEAPPVTRMR